MIRTFRDPEAVSRAAADLFVASAQEAIARRGRFNVALSGGRTPLGTYQLLAEPHWRDRTPWRQIDVFWGDERCVPLDDVRSNAGMAVRTLLTHVPVTAGCVHPIGCAGDPEAGASDYEALLRTHFPEIPALDLIFLGLGQDGHTASLFPNSPVLSEKERWAVAVHRGGREIPRVTLTPIVLNAAAVVVFLVCGQDKARALRTVLKCPRQTRRLPAQFIHPVNGRLIWLTDEAAAAELGEPADLPAAQRPRS
jgi:6-phosphogluconolactonase